MATKAKKKVSAKSAVTKKAPSGAKVSAKKTAKPEKTQKAASVVLEGGVASLENLDRKGLAAKARQLKLELLAVRFNVQAPSLKDYKKKRQELARVLAQLGA